jgi:hypothetical protein
LLRNLAIAVAALAVTARAQDLKDQPAGQDPVQQELARLRARVDALEQGRANGKAAERDGAIDLSDAELPSIAALHSGGVSTRPWYENVAISGYGAFDYINSGGAGSVRDALLVKEASLFLEAQVWENISFYFETWITRFLFDSGHGNDVGELYVKFSDLFGTRDGARLGLKLGRIDIPFGEDYLRQDATDDPLISLSAADVWAIDEGAAAYGRAGPLHWVFAVTNGNIALGADDGPSKLVCGKLYADVNRDLYLSASLLKSGKSGASTIWFGRGLITPVGLFDTSSAGTSPSEQVDSTLWEVDAHVCGARRASLRLQFGEAFIDDHVNAFDRNLLWFQVEPAILLSEKLAFVTRYSQLATDNSNEGYLFEGDVFGSGGALGYDAHRMQRVACGLDWTINPHAKFKLEVGHDWYDVIAGSPFDPRNDKRLYGAMEIVASF